MLKPTGFYYFIFTNDNEITNNFVAASFDLRKTVFDVTSRSQVLKTKSMVWFLCLMTC